MARRDRRDVAGPDLALRPVAHANPHATRAAVEEVRGPSQLSVCAIGFRSPDDVQPRSATGGACRGAYFVVEPGAVSSPEAVRPGGGAASSPDCARPAEDRETCAVAGGGEGVGMACEKPCGAGSALASFRSPSPGEGLGGRPGTAPEPRREAPGSPGCCAAPSPKSGFFRGREREDADAHARRGGDRRIERRCG
jgi:hypothetical protein